MTLRETFIAAMAEVDGLKLVVTRHYPRGVARVRFDRWLPALAPSRELLHDRRHGLVTWEEYRSHFREEILGSAEALTALRHIVDLAGTRDVYLICWEPEPPCHRWLLMDLARELSGGSPLTGRLGSRRRRAPELVHGLTEPVELADWDYAIIIAALKLYRAQRAEAGDVVRARYADRITGKLRRPFAELIRRTKRKHRELKAIGADGQLTLTTIDLEEVEPT